MSIWLQKSASIQPRTSPLKFDDFADDLSGNRGKVRYRTFQLSYASHRAPIAVSPQLTAPYAVSNPGSGLETSSDSARFAPSELRKRPSVRPRRRAHQTSENLGPAILSPTPPTQRSSVIWSTFFRLLQKTLKNWCESFETSQNYGMLQGKNVALEKC